MLLAVGLAGLFLGSLLTWLWLRAVAFKREAGLAAERDQARVELAGARERIRQAEGTAESRERESAKLRADLARADSETQVQGERLRAQVERHEEIKRFLADFEAKSKAEFESLAARVLDTKSKTFAEQTERGLGTLLKPFQERIQAFEKKVEDTYQSEARERFALKGEVDKLVQLNDRMSREAANLTQALKGDSKIQGDWGELVLERLLEASGLREGHEYTVQKELREEGARFRPDVIVNLPENRHLIIDSKVSLRAYEQLCRVEDAKERETLSAAHVAAIRAHVKELAERHYERLPGINSPLFVFLFLPIEPAYIAAMQSDPELHVDAWRKNVIVLTSTTLFTSLQTVAHLWKLENQNKNAQEIAAEASKLYDKFVGFLDDFEKLGRLFESGQAQYGTAFRKLKEGPGNIFRRMENLRELGAAPANRIKPELLE